MATERGPLMLRPTQRPSPGTDTVAFTAMVLALVMVVMEVMALDTATERGLLRPSQKLMPGWDMVDSMATVVLALAMVVTALDTALDTATERGLLTLMPTMPMDTPPTATMAMERGPLMLRPSQRLMPGLDMVDSTATVV